MIKLGITERGAGADRALRLERQKRGWWPFAYTLLEGIHAQYSPLDDALLDRIYRSMAAGRGIQKITAEGRFNELDQLLAETMADGASSHDGLVIHDMGASNGITSLELFERLSRQNVLMNVTDFFDRCFCVAVNPSWTVVLDALGSPLQVVGRKFVLSAYRQEPWRYLCNRVLQACVCPWAVRTAKECWQKWQEGDASTIASGSVREVSLFHPRCIAEAARNSRFRLGRHSVFEVPRDAYDVVRVMNLLTEKHMSRDDISRAVRSSTATLRIGGLFVTGRSIDEEDGRCRATIFSRDPDRLRPLTRLNDGAEAEEQIAALRF